MQQIAVECPRCLSRYQVSPDLRGKRMRCPNPMCRAVFDVQPVGAAPLPEPPRPAEPPPPNRPTQVSGSVADFVPLLPAEALEPTPPPIVPPPAAPPPEKPTPQRRVEVPVA